MENLKLFVGGYYDDRIFRGEWFEGKTPFDKKINTYSLLEVEKLPFIDGVIDYFKEKEENKEKEWEEATFEEKVKAILDYSDTDEIAGLIFFETEKEAEDYKNEIIEEIEDIEKNIVYRGLEQDNYGAYREVYVYKNDLEE